MSKDCWSRRRNRTRKSSSWFTPPRIWVPPATEPSGVCSRSVVGRFSDHTSASCTQCKWTQAPSGQLSFDREIAISSGFSAGSSVEIGSSADHEPWCQSTNWNRGKSHRCYLWEIDFYGNTQMEVFNEYCLTLSKKDAINTVWMIHASGNLFNSFLEILNL